ncbi:MAG: hypothetical protein IIA87_05305 [Nanoarchaeota archaeon]|nr:hypothetical protein [Nanoarchaeota archaeon]
MISELARSIDGNMVRWDYEQLCIFGVVGILERPLSDIGILYDTNAWEVAPVRPEPNFNRDFLASFHFRPPVDLTVDKSYGSNNASIVSFSLDRKRSRALVSELMEKSGFQARSPDPAFIRDIETGHLPELSSYDCAVDIAQHLKKPLEKVFGAIHYMNFLGRYRGLPNEEQLKRANERFGIRFPAA